MGKTVQSVKGMRDLLPPETAVWAAVEAIARRVFTSYGYGEIRTPVLEETELFVRGVGESTDIVGKEMYTFPDKKGRSLTLRPENTAAVARAYVEHNLQNWPHPVKLFYIGPQFRYERPQKGRYRQFNQIGAELIGDGNPEADVELLIMLFAFLKRLGFADLKVLINTVGDQDSRFWFSAALRDYLRPHEGALSEDSKRRLNQNPLRILDTKDPKERELLLGAPSLEESLSEASKKHFLRIRELLDQFGVPYRVDPRLVRGLDYYTHTVFEIVAEGLGAQNAIVGGGSYDQLIANLGGPGGYAIGFAIGEERLIEVLPEEFRQANLPPSPVVVAVAGQLAKGNVKEALVLAEEVRSRDIPAVADYKGRSLKAVFKWAEQLGSWQVLILGDEELAAGEVTIKDLRSGEQRRLARTEAIDLLTAGGTV